MENRYAVCFNKKLPRNLRSVNFSLFCVNIRIFFSPFQCRIGEVYWDKAFKDGPSQFCAIQPLKKIEVICSVCPVTSNFLKAAFFKYYLVHSSMLCLIQDLVLFMMELRFKFFVRVLIRHLIIKGIYHFHDGDPYHYRNQSVNLQCKSMDLVSFLHHERLKTNRNIGIKWVNWHSHVNDLTLKSINFWKKQSSRGIL